jgi:hypothetical protein
MLDVGQFNKQIIQIVSNDIVYKNGAVSVGWIRLAQG